MQCAARAMNKLYLIANRAMETVCHRISASGAAKPNAIPKYRCHFPPLLPFRSFSTLSGCTIVADSFHLLLIHLFRCLSERHDISNKIVYSHHFIFVLNHFGPITNFIAGVTICLRVIFEFLWMLHASVLFCVFHSACVNITNTCSLFFRKKAIP